MDSKQFYLTLPSNSTASNTASNFITKLPRHIVLNGDWEVGLAEIIYANTWHNVQMDDNTLEFFDVKKNMLVKVQIPPARYINIHELLHVLNRRIVKAGSRQKRDYAPRLSLKYNEFRKYCSLMIDTEYIHSLKLTPHLTYMLGFSENQIRDIDYTKAEAKTIIADHTPDMLGGMHNFFVYCDIVEPQIVGNVFAPLLQVVNIEGKYMEIINHSYISPHYVPILKKSFNTIEINLKTDQNEAVPFEFGKTIVKLHFRQR